MPTCFVIQPFSSKFDKRYDDVYKPALEQAGLKVYRVDQDPGTEKLIDSIEAEIRNATICLADITTDNPNVWYELGYAFAVGRSVVLVCSTEREGKLPFDIQHRTVIEYAPESPSDFSKLCDKISTRAKALVKKNGARQAIEAQQVAPTDGLSHNETSVLAIAAAATTTQGTGVRDGFLRSQATKAGLTDLGVAVAIRSLKRQGFLELRGESDISGLIYYIVYLTDRAWHWIGANESLFSPFTREKK